MGKKPPDRRHEDDMKDESRQTNERKWFIYHLRTALVALYNPAILRNSPLTQVFGLDQRPDALSALRRVLIDGIEALNANINAPAESSTWRTYQILRRRYIEQVPQRKVAADLGFSVRQVQREERLAREMLADHLWFAHQLQNKLQNLSTTGVQPGTADFERDIRVPTAQEELEQMEGSIPAQMENIGETVASVLQTVGPLMESKGTRGVYSESQDLPRVWIKAPLLRQALLNLISLTIHYGPSEDIHIQAEADPGKVCIRIQTAIRQDISLPQSEERSKQLEMTDKLITLCQGSLDIDLGDTVESVFVATITLPIQEQKTILVIDDNADTRRLFQQYLLGSPYRLISADSAQQGLAFAKAVSPQVIILDLMMPDEDGWSLLWQLREHPQTSEIPIIVCTILPLQELGLVLGAAEFIHKPVTRPAFLAALSRQIDPLAKKLY